MLVRYNRVRKLIILTRLCVEFFNVVDLVLDKIFVDITFEYI